MVAIPGWRKGFQHASKTALRDMRKSDVFRYVCQAKSFQRRFHTLIGVIEGKLSLHPDPDLFPVIFELPCPEAAISLLQAGEAARRTIAAPGASYAPGEAVSVRTGPLSDHHGVVVRTTASHAVVALMLLGRLVEASVRLDALARPAA
jgi:hypothetical protein